MAVSGPAAAALQSLNPEQIAFLKKLPKAELHAHLNGSIPVTCLRDLARDYANDSSSNMQGPSSELVDRGILLLENGVSLDLITDFFSLFPAIYALTSTPKSLHKATLAVLDDFLAPDDDGFSQCTFMELRTTPRRTPHMSRIEYLTTVLDAMEKYSGQCSLIVSVDWRMSAEDAEDTVNAALALRGQGRNIVGVDLCGDFTLAKPAVTIPILKKAQIAGLKLTVHIAESASNPKEETDALLGLSPDRLGHATFLDETASQLVRDRKTPVEICLSSNLLCKTVPALNDHHIIGWIQASHPVCICTDDTLPFRTNLLAEYAMLIADSPYGLSFSRDKVQQIAAMSMQARFV